MIVEIFNVIQNQAGIERLYLRNDLEDNDPSHYASTWGAVRKKKITDGRVLLAEFLRRAVSLETVDAKNNALICCAAMLLDLSCLIEDFADYVRRQCLDARFDCCVLTNCGDELDLLCKSGDYIEEGGAEMTQIKGWANGEEGKRSMYTLSIGGESGSGKTRSALQCAKFYRTKHSSVQQQNVLTVYIKVSRENTNVWDPDMEDKDEFTLKAARIMQDMWDKSEKYKRSFPKCKSNAFLEECIKNSATDGVALRHLRVAQGYKWVCDTIKKTQISPSYWNRRSPSMLRSSF
ncbi:hypothetical protein AGDE_17195 [Angomonas deanei]|uniref:Uncharacterized protein n=1 Tax=Angomonas deanei TaxID=59799 RepID=A0A7G2CCC6_9TRYP|nr:hypothetical protein AGDE_17195 [Angomonas deanei]CAD2217466.1 hypothetical protein, conserved [Angomonas deanei]|eukprot:EPY15069.1 hypothetical protein AGDE_17195 [Angomonas deanei]